jgi:hypothetical protein
VLVQGTATIRCVYRGVPEEPRTQYSGCCFDMGERTLRLLSFDMGQASRLQLPPCSAALVAGTLNVFGIFIGFEKFNDLHTFSAVADTDCLLYCWTIEELAAMATELAPAGGGNQLCL